MYRSLLLPMLVAVIAALSWVTPVSADNTAPAIDAFNQAFASVNDYTYKLHSREGLGSQTQDRVYDYWFMKPHYAKTYIESGDGQGSGGVWNGGDRVSGHQGGILAAIHINVDLHDGRAVSLRGMTVPDGLIQNIVATYATTTGKLIQEDGGTLQGVPTDRLELDVADPTTTHGVTKMILYLNQNTHFPLRQLLYTGDTIVVDQTFIDLRTNVGLTQNDFPF